MNRIIFIALTLLACADDTYTEDDANASSYQDEYYTNPYEGGTYAPIEGLMAGHMASNGSFQRPITNGEAWTYPSGLLTLEAHAIGDAWAMVAVTIPLDQLENGVTTTFGPHDIDTIGCSGERPYEFLFDGPAVQTDVTVDVEPDGSMHVSIWADFGNGDHVTTVVVVPVPDAG